VSCEWKSADGLTLASSPLSLVPPAPLWYSLCGSAVDDGEDYPPRRHCSFFFGTTHSVVVNKNIVRDQLP
jgi:hypothetical protein